MALNTFKCTYQMFSWLPLACFQQTKVNLEMYIKTVACVLFV